MPHVFARLVPENGVQLSSGFYSGKCKTCNKEVKFWSVPSPVSEITFTVNGTQYTVNNPDPGMSLNEWIRNQPGLQGTKVMCREAGCGCCVVSITRRDLSVSKDVTVAVNSCLFPLCAVNGTTVTTIEGIGNRYDGFHPIQERLAEHNGSQCGYCSPGFVMNMYSLLKETPSPSEQQIEDSFDGNICRCTGYRPILDAMKTFAKSSNPLDIEEIAKCPVSAPMETCSVLESASQHMFIKAATVCCGIFKNDGPFDVMIDITKVEKLHTIPPSATEVPNGDVVIGSGVSLNTLISVLDDLAKVMSGYKVLADHVRKVANVPVRNVGSIAGNLMLTHDHPDFPSDIFTILEAAGTRLIIGKTRIDFIIITLTSFCIITLSFHYVHPTFLI
ncbi:hypothetical protein OS493_004623 [Desmophyllum pertusum]|uniref:Xanthine dehydrogenase n=1 Tax=Desmophyllum pertusum TaxID=174260 RepID=A0A9X0CYX0_9CNID|nr:hypothetical protein OS493_004623 [Desmophyllum pertusum]